MEKKYKRKRLCLNKIILKKNTNNSVVNVSSVVAIV